MNIIWPQKGKYIVAVSGGVDSVCLLDMLMAHGGYELVVAHVDHGIREDSTLDLELVKKLAAHYQLPFVSKALQLGEDASEAEARAARYDFLFETMKDHGAAGIITAHHADDLLETSIMNVRRGTDRYGAAGGMNRQGIVRPLINITKAELLDYARQHNLQWREDSTNRDPKYTRNQVRHQVIPSIDAATYKKHLTQLADINQKLDSELAGLVSISEAITITRLSINQLSLRELEVLLAYALRQARPGIELNQPRIAAAAQQIMLGTDKISFSIGATDCIIIDIP